MITLTNHVSWAKALITQEMNTSYEYIIIMSHTLDGMSFVMTYIGIRVAKVLWVGLEGLS